MSGETMNQQTCILCGTLIEWPAYGAVSKGQAGMRMYDGNRGWQVIGDGGEEIALCSYTIDDCHGCGKRRAQEKLAATGKIGRVRLIGYEYVDGLGRLDEVIEGT